MEMAPDAKQIRRAVLDPLDRVSEIVFGVLMALSITGALSVATAGSGEIRTMLLTALGCNLAWGLTDAVMYLVSTATEKHRTVALLQRLQSTNDANEAHRLIVDELPSCLAAGADEGFLEALRTRLVAARVPTTVRLSANDYAGALGVFALVLLATFPVVVPFIFIAEPTLALRVSNLLGLAALFIGGSMLGHYAGGVWWRSGLVMTAIGAGLVTVIIALGG